MNGKLEGRIALITGAGSGIGRATVTLFARNGAAVTVADVDESAARSVADEITGRGGTARAAMLDVTCEADWRAAIEALLSGHDRLDILVNCAGISGSRPIADTTLDDWRRVMAVNLDGAFLGTRYAIDAMRAGGSIVNVASVAGIKPFGGASAYCTSKAALRMFTRVAAIECADAGNGIRVNLVTPAGVKTPMWDKEGFFQALTQVSGGREQAFAKLSGDKASTAFFEPDEIAKTILYLASDDATHISGTEIIMDRGNS